MSLYHLHAGVVSRSVGRSLAGAMAYAMGEKVECTVQGVTYDYSYRNDVSNTGSFLPENAPDWMNDYKEFAAYAEEFENDYADARWRGNTKDEVKNAKSLATKDGFISSTQTAQTLEVSFQKELTEEQNLEILKAFCEDVFLPRGLCVYYGIHHDKNNPHAHLIISRRPIVTSDQEKMKSFQNPEGDFSLKKDQWIMSKVGLLHIRKKWEIFVNLGLEKAGINRRVDCRSFKDQDIALLGTKKLGYNAIYLDKKGEYSRIVHENELIRESNLQTIVHNPQILIKRIASEYRDFTPNDIEEGVAHYFEHNDVLMGEYFEALAQKYPTQTQDKGERKWEDMITKALVDSEDMQTIVSRNNQTTFRLKEIGQGRQVDLEQLSRSILGEHALFSRSTFVDLAVYRLVKSHVLLEDVRTQLGLPELDKEQVKQFSFAEEDGFLDLQKKKVNLEAYYVADALYEQYSRHENVVKVGQYASGEDVYAAKSYVERERNIFETVDAFLNRPVAGPKSFVGRFFDKFKSTDNQIIGRVVDEFQEQRNIKLDPKQIKAIHYLTARKEQGEGSEEKEQKSQDIFVLQGKAGTGKTTIMRLVSDIWEEKGYHIKGMTFQGAAASQLQRDIGRGCSTFNKFLDDLQILKSYESKRWWENTDKDLRPEMDSEESGTEQKKSKRISKYKYMSALERTKLTDKTVLIIDEANMVADHLYAPVLELARKAGSKVILVGDTGQALGHIRSNIFKGILEKVGFVELTNIVRQAKGWMKQASLELSEHNIQDAILKYVGDSDVGEKLIHWRDDKHEAMFALASELSQDLANGLHAVALAHKNDDVAMQNQYTRNILKKNGTLQNPIQVNLDKKGGFELCVGEHIVFERNENIGKHVVTLDHDDGFRGVRTGDIGKVLKIDQKQNKIVVQLHNEPNKRSEKIVEVDLKEYGYINYGYAVTINRSEGKTFDKTLLYYSKALPANLAYVAMTRHKHGFAGYVAKDELVDVKALVDTTAFSEYKPLVRDFELTGRQVKAKQNVERYLELNNEIVSVKEDLEKWTEVNKDTFKDEESELWGITLSPGYAYYQDLYVERQELALEIYKNWKDHQTICEQSRLVKRWIGVTAGVTKALLSDEDKERLRLVKLHKELNGQVTHLRDTMLKEVPFAFFDEHKSYERLKDVISQRNVVASQIKQDLQKFSKFFVLHPGKNGEKYDYFGDKVDFPIGRKTIIRQSKEMDKELQREGLFNSLDEEGKASFKALENYVSYKMKLKTLGAQSAKLRAEYEHLKGIDFKTEEVEKKMQAVDARYHSYFVNRGQAIATVLNGPEYRKLVKEFGVAEEFEKLSTVYLHKNFNDQVNALKRDIGKIRLNEHERYPELLDLIERRGAIATLIVSDIKSYSKYYRANPNQDGTFYNIFGEKVDYPIGKKRLEQQSLKYEKQKIEKNTKPEVKRAVRQERLSFDLEEVKRALADRVEDLAEQVFTGNVSKRTVREIRYGKKGSIVVHISGPKAGGWTNFESGQSGTAFDILTKVMGMDFKTALEYGASFAGVSPQKREMEPQKLLQRKKELEAKREQEILAEKKEKELKINIVQKNYVKTQQASQTLAERYLRETRAIKNAFLPSDIRFHPAYYCSEDKQHYPALVAIARDGQGKIIACQATYLDEKTLGKAKHLDVQKRSLGALQGAFVTIQEGAKNQPIFMGEGLETAMSIKEAGVQGKILCSLGISNYRNLNVAKGDHVIICKDHDEAKSRTHKFIREAKEHLESKGAKVTIVQPEKEGEDFNDVLKTGGKKAVQNYFKDYIPQKEQGKESQPQTVPHQQNNSIDQAKIEKLFNELKPGQKIRDQVETHLLSVHKENSPALQEKVDQITALVHGMKMRAGLNKIRISDREMMLESERILDRMQKSHDKDIKEIQTHHSVCHETARLYLSRVSMIENRYSLRLNDQQKTHVMQSARHEVQRAQEFKEAYQHKPSRSISDSTFKQVAHIESKAVLVKALKGQKLDVKGPEMKVIHDSAVKQQHLERTRQQQLSQQMQHQRAMMQSKDR